MTGVVGNLSRRPQVRPCMGCGCHTVGFMQKALWPMACWAGTYCHRIMTNIDECCGRVLSCGVISGRFSEAAADSKSCLSLMPVGPPTGNQ